MTTPMLMRTDGLAPIPPVSCEEWLRVLTRRMDLRRLGVLMLKGYADGNAPLPEMTKDTKQTWQDFQRRARTNWGELVVDSVVDRLVPNGITVNGSNSTPLAKQAAKIWRDNRMQSVFKEWTRYGIKFGQSYLTVWGGQQTPDSLSGTVITADSPETMIVVTDPLQHWKPRAAMKVWRNIEEARDYALVWTSGAWQQFVRPTYTNIELKIIPSKWLVNLAEGAWTSDGQPGGRSEGGLPTPIPVVVYNNPGGHGDYETHLDLINRINGGILERLVIQAMQAFRQRCLKGGTLPERDEKGNLIKWNEIFAPVPGALWNLPEGFDIWESTPVELQGLLLSSKEDVRQLSAVSRTPLPMLMPDNTNTSAEGAKATEGGHLFRCYDRLGEAKFGVERCMELALRADKKSGTMKDDDVLEVRFQNVELITLGEKYAAALAAHNAGESWKSIQRNVLGYSPDQIAQDAIDRAEEALLASTMPPAPTTVQERIVASPGGQPAAPNGQQPQPKPPQPSPQQKRPVTTVGGTQPGGRG